MGRQNHGDQRILEGTLDEGGEERFSFSSGGAGLAGNAPDKPWLPPDYDLAPNHWFTNHLHRIPPP